MAKNNSVPSVFDEIASAFADYGTTIRGYVRYHLSQRNLKPYVKAPPPLSVLDVGGGSGADAAWLANMGHRVTFMEPSIEQRRYAERRFNFLLQDKARSRVRIVEGSLQDMPASAKASFDLVLIHGVAMYQEEPNEFTRRALQFVKPGGLASVIDKGYYGTEMRAIHDGDYTNLRRLRSTGRSLNDLKQRVRSVKPEELEKLLAKSGFDVLEWSGIRVLTDDLTTNINKLDARKLKIILDAEYRQGHHPSIRGQGQLLHFIVRRRAD